MVSNHPRERFREVLNGQECVFPIAVFDAISARIAANLGFEVGMIAGSVMSMAILGLPDVMVMTLTEFAEQTRRISRADTGLPLFADADHGYGNALNVMRTVQELETAGISALTIEDTLLPKAYGKNTPELISIEEGVGKMKAALLARKDPELAIIGRTGAAGKTSLEDAVQRAKAYEAAGVDGIFLAFVKDWEQVEEISKSVSLPILLGNIPASMTAPTGDAAFLRERRVRSILRGNQPFLAAIQGVYEAMRRLRNGEDLSTLPMPSSKLVEDLTLAAAFTGWDADLLGR